jgi:hypothetical protein
MKEKQHKGQQSEGILKGVYRASAGHQSTREKLAKSNRWIRRRVASAALRNAIAMVARAESAALQFDACAAGN